MLLSRGLELSIPVLCAVLMGVGIHVAWLEGQAFLRTPTSAEDRFSAIADGRIVPGLSSYSTRYSLQDCEMALTGAYGRLQSEGLRKDAAAACGEMAARAIDRSPLDALAHTIGARADAVLGDMEGAGAGILRSARAAPHEMWQAHRRMLVVREWSLDGEPAVAQQFRRDIAVLASTREGRAALARWYVNQPERRDLIVSVVDEIGERDKRDFLNAVRTASQAQ